MCRNSALTQFGWDSKMHCWDLSEMLVTRLFCHAEDTNCFAFLCQLVFKANRRTFNYPPETDRDWLRSVLVTISAAKQTHRLLLPCCVRRTQQKAHSSQSCAQSQAGGGAYMTGFLTSSVWVKSRPPTSSNRNNLSSWRLKTELHQHGGDIKRERFASVIPSLPSHRLSPLTSLDQLPL